MLQALSQILFLAFGALLLLGSGLGILWLVPSLRRRLSGIEATIVALLLSSAVAGLWALAGKVIGLRITSWAVLLAVASALLLAAGFRARRAARARGEMRPVPEPRYYRAVVLSLAAVAFLLILREGGSLGPVHDSLDFVSFVNETLQSGDLAPPSPIYEAAPGIPPDPRRGSFHTEVAAICALSATPPTDAWKWLPRLLAPIAILGLAAMLRAWIGTRAAALAAVLFFATTFFTIDRFIQNIGYASRFGWVCGWGALLLLAKAFDPGAAVDRRERRILLAIAAASPAFLLSVHLLTAFQLLLALGCAGLAILCDRAASRAERAAVIWTIAGAALLIVPALAIKLAGAPAGQIAANPLFDHLYGVLLIRPGWPVLLPSVYFERAGISGIIASLLSLALLPGFQRSRAAGFLAFSTLIPLAIIFFPPIARILIGMHAHSLFSRVVLTIPFAGILAWAILRAIDAARAGGGRRIGGVAVLCVIALALAMQIVSTRSTWAVVSKSSLQYRESRPLLAALDFLQERFPKAETILSDPITSYAIPAYTRHNAVSPFAQHSSPSDPTVDDRIRDVQEALNGRVGLARTFEVIRRYHAGLILVNQSFPRYQQAYYVFISPYAYDEQAAKFEGAPALFEKLYDAQGVRIYRVHDPPPDASLAGDPPNPARAADPGTPPILRCGPVEILSAASRKGVHPAAKPCPVDILWRCGGTAADLPVDCDLKLQLHDPPDRGRADVIGRLIALFAPAMGRDVGRFGRTVRPLQTYYPDFLWKPGEAYKEAVWISVPPRARSGLYDLYIRLRTEPCAPVVSLSEVLSTRLGPDWKLVDRVEIGPAALPAEDQQPH